jgi:hypothetical protein
METYTPHITQKIQLHYYYFSPNKEIKLTKLHKQARKVALEWEGSYHYCNVGQRITCFLQGYYKILFAYRKNLYDRLQLQDLNIKALENAMNKRFCYQDTRSIEERRWAFMRGVNYCIKTNKMKKRFGFSKMVKQKKQWK